MEDLLFGWLILAAWGAFFSVWETRRPNRDIALKSALPEELRSTALVFCYEVCVMFAFALALPYIFSESLLAVVQDTGLWALPGWARFLCMFLLFDLTFYFVHRFMHTRSAWRVHRFHHEPKNFFFLITLRATIPHMIMTRMCVVAWAIIFNVDVVWMIVFMVYAGFHGFFQHLNVTYPWMRHIEWLLTTPRSHVIHHFVEPRYANKNFGGILAIWDHLFGTWMSPEDIDDLNQKEVGINDNTHPIKVALGI